MPSTPSKATYPFPGLWGWMGVFGLVVGFDAWAMLTHRATLSRTLGHYLAHPILGPILAGAWLGLGYHLLAEELIPEILAERAASQ